MLRTANPTLNENTFAGLNNLLDAATAPRTMTVSGTAHKLGLFLLLAVFTASFVWGKFTSEAAAAAAAMESNVITAEAAQVGFQSIMGWAMGGAIGGLILSLVTYFKPRLAPFTGSGYALCQGLFLGGISAFMETVYPGIVLQAIGLTFGIAAAMVLLYSSGVLRASSGLVKGVVAATVGIMLFYVAAMVLRLMGIHVGLIHEMMYGSGLIGIGFSVFVIILASLNLILDFDLVESGAKRGAPKYMEWYCAFGLMVTLVWLYIEALRLLAKLKGRE